MIFNKDRTKAHLEEFGLRAVVATSSVNVSYFTDFDCWMYRLFRENMSHPGAPNSLMQSYAVLDKDLEVDLVIRGDTAPFASELKLGGIVPYIEKIGHHDVPGKRITTKNGRSRNSTLADSPGAALVRVLKAKGVTRGKVGIELNNLSEHSSKLLKKELPGVKLLDCTDFIRLIRMIKTPEELERLGKAAEINELSILKVLQRAKEGMKMGELILDYSVEVAKQGAVYDHFIYSPNGVGFTNVPSHVLTRDEHMCVDFGFVYRGYYSDSGKSLILGNPSSDWLAKYKTLWENIEEAKDKVRPGVKPSSIVEDMDRRLSSHGLNNVGAHGHGIGRESREHPVIMPTNYKEFHDGVVRQSVDIPFEEGMTINLESALLLPNKGSVHVERTFLVSKDRTSELWPQHEGLPMIV